MFPATVSLLLQRITSDEHINKFVVRSSLLERSSDDLVITPDPPQTPDPNLAGLKTAQLSRILMPLSHWSGAAVVRSLTPHWLVQDINLRVSGGRLSVTDILAT